MKFDKFTDVCMTGGIRHTPSHTNVCKFFIFQLQFNSRPLRISTCLESYIFSADITPDMLKLSMVTKVKVLFLVLVYVFNFKLFEFSATILEKGLLALPYFGPKHVNFARFSWPLTWWPE